MSTDILGHEIKDDFNRGVIVSMAIHVAIFGGFLVRNLVFPPKPYEAAPAVRVDIVALPDKMPNLPPAPAPAPEPVAEKPAPKAEAKPAAPPKPLPKKADDAIKLEKTKDKEKAAIEKLKTMAAMDKIKEELARERTEAEKKRLEELGKARAQKIKGNVLSPGTALTGIDKLDYDEYGGALDRHIKPYWQLPEWIARKGYRAQAIVRVDARGQLISRQLIRSSGNPEFDQNALETIDRASPMPAPPEKLAAVVGTQGIVIDFGEEKGTR